MYLNLWITGILLLSGAVQTRAQSNAISNAVPKEASLQKIRRLHLFPDYRSIQPGEYAGRLNTKQKFQFFAGRIFDVGTLVTVAGVSGIQQGADLAPNYGQGGEAYAKRLGATAASFATSSFLSDALLPTLFHEDPRYFKKGTGSVPSRILYAVTRTVVTRTDSGSNSFNYALILGAAGNSALQNAYFPEVNRTASHSSYRFAIGIGVSAVLNIGREFRRQGPESVKP